jgi:flagellar hook-associated protein 3 FlgL
MTTDANGYVTAVIYQGNQSVIEREVAEGSTMEVQAIGANSSGSGPRGVITDSRFGADLFNHLIALQNHLLAHDTAAITNTDRPALAKDEDNLVLHLGSNAAAQARLEASDKLLATRSLTVEKQVSREADADLSQTLVRLGQVQNAYRAALDSGARLLNQSLLDYIR